MGAHELVGADDVGGNRSRAPVPQLIGVVVRYPGQYQLREQIAQGCERDGIGRDPVRTGQLTHEIAELRLQARGKPGVPVDGRAELQRPPQVAAQP